MRIGPSAERQARLVTPDGLAQLPRVGDAARRADRLVAAQDDERIEAVLLRTIGVRQAVVQRMLAGQERNHRRARHVAAEIDDQVPEVVFLFRSDGAVGEEHERAVAGEALHRVIGVDPRIHAGGRFELGARRAKLCGDDRIVSAKTIEKCWHPDYRGASPRRIPAQVRAAGPRLAVARGAPSPRSAPARAPTARHAREAETSTECSFRSP